MLSSAQTQVARYRYDPYMNLLSSEGSLAEANDEDGDRKMGIVTLRFYIAH